MTSRSVSMADPVKVPVNVAVTLKMIIVFGPAWIGGPAKLKQGLKLPLTGPGVPASALGNVNVAPAIASAQKHLRRCDRRRFRLNQQFIFIYMSKRDRKSTRLNSSHRTISYAVFCLKKKKKKKKNKNIKKKIKN